MTGRGAVRATDRNAVGPGGFGLLDELTLMWVAGRGERLDIQKVPEWVSSLVLRGILSQKGQAT